jgi:hypothetical protein
VLRFIANARAQAARGKRTQHGTESESRVCLQRACSAYFALLKITVLCPSSLPIQFGGSYSTPPFPK